MPEPDIRPEERLLAALLRHPKSAPRVSIEATHLWFLSPILGIAFDAAVNYACESGAAPTREILLELMGRRSPESRLAHSEALIRIWAIPAGPDEAQHIPYFCQALETDWKARTAKQVMLAAADMLDKGRVYDAVESLQRDIAIPLTKFTGGEFSRDFGAFWNEYERIEKDPSLRQGVQLGFKTIDDATKGHFNKELWVMVGGSGVGKSLWLGQVAINAATTGKRVLLITVENSYEAYMRRIYSNACGIDYQDLKTAALSGSDKARLFEGIANVPESFHLEVIHMNPPCCARDILNIMRSSKTRYDYLVVDQITNMAPNHPKDFRVMDWRWYSQVALELRTLGGSVYDGRGIPVHTAVHAAGGTTDKKELTTDDTALAKSIGYHADAMLYLTKKDNEYLVGKSKLRDAHFEPFTVFPTWSRWRISEEPPTTGYGRTVEDAQADTNPKPAKEDPSVSFDIDALEREITEQNTRDDAAALIGQTVPLDFVPSFPPVDVAPIAPPIAPYIPPKSTDDEDGI
jgi:hypothetical protein